MADNRKHKNPLTRLLGWLVMSSASDMKKSHGNLGRKLTATFLFSAIILVFVFWGLSPRSGMNSMTSSGGGAAVVNSTTISMRDLGEAMEQMKNQYAKSPLASFFEGEEGRARMQQMVLNQLIQSEVLYQACNENGIWTSNASVADFIRSVPAFQDKGQFQRERYMTYLNNQNMAASEFEEKLRKGMTSRDAQRLFTEALRVTPQEVAKQKDLKGLKADLDFVTLHTEQMEKPEQVPAKEVQEFLAKPENDKRVKDYYASHPAEFAQEESVHARHILVKFEEAKPDSVAAAKTKAEGLLARLKKGEDFAKLASENSDDPGSKAKGGDLGFFGKGKMVPEFEAAAFSLAPQKMSDLVKTHYGYHIIQTLEKKTAEKTPIETARNTIAQKLVAESKSEALLTEIKDLLKKGDGPAIEKWVTEHKMKWDSTGTFDISATSVPKIGAIDDAVKVAFTLKKDAPYAKELVRQGAQAFVLKYRAPTADKPEAAAKVAKGKKPMTSPAAQDESPDALTNRFAQEVFGHWVTGLTKVAHIERNRNTGSSQNEPAPDF